MIDRRRFLASAAAGVAGASVFGSATGASGALGADAQAISSAPVGPVFNVKDHGATGRKQDDARPAIQQAIDECGKAGGGTVYVPPGEYTSGTIHMRSGVRLYLEAGATIFASLDGKQFDEMPKSALIFGEDLHDIALDGRGTLDGQATYFWGVTPPDFIDYYIRPNQIQMEITGKPLSRSFPTGFEKETVYPRNILLLRCEDVRITGLKIIHSRSWTVNLYACKRLLIDGVYIYSSPKEGVWADGIDPDGCTDVRIANCTIDTGDDAIVLWSAAIWGPALPTEGVTITNCRLSSASSALKFCDGNANAIRRVTIDNVVITRSNRGLAFMTFQGGVVEDVVVSNVSIETPRFDWFWWGDGDPIHFNIKKGSELDGKPHPGEPPPGKIRNISISNVIAHGTGTSVINGHPDSWLENIHFDNVRLFVSHDPDAPYESTHNAMTIKQARNFSIKDSEIGWEKQHADSWKTGLIVEDVENFRLDTVDVHAAPGSNEAAVELTNAAGVTLRATRTNSIHLAGKNTRDVRVSLTDAKIDSAAEVGKDAIIRE